MRQCVLLLLLAALLPGCDVIAVGTYLANRDEANDDDDGSGATIIITPPEEPPPPDPVYRVWIANLATVGECNAQVDALSAAQGMPDENVWSIVGSALTGATFDPTATPTSFNTVMIQGSNAVGYGLDAVEVLDVTDLTLASGSESETYSSLVVDAAKCAGLPDGSGASLPPSNNRAFVFFRFTAPIAKIRVTMTGGALSGDLVWTSTWPVGSNSGDEIPGGCAVLNEIGVLYVSVSDWNSSGSSRDVKIVRYDPDGTLMGETTVETGVTATAGSHSLAYAGGMLTIASTVNNNVMVRRYNSDLSSVQWSTSLDALGQGDALRVESNGLSADLSGVAVGGAGDDGLLGGGINHRVWRLSVLGTFAWVNNLTGDGNATYWHGVAMHPSNNAVAACGEATNGLLGPIHDSTRWINSNGNTNWTAQETVTTTAPDRLNAVAFDTSIAPVTVVVAGRYPVPGQGLNAVLMKWPASGGSTPTMIVTHNGGGNADDEILDIAVDTDGSIYAVGYESPGMGEGQNFWVRRYSPTGVPTWTRTYNAGGDERAVSVTLLNQRVYVVGQETAQGGTKRVIVRTYAK